MSDLIERLRDDNSDTPYTDRHLAADRIAELEAENARLRDELAKGGHFVGNGDGTKWRTWKDGWPEWTTDLGQATIYRTRHDAEQIHMHDEDAWRIVPFLEARAALKEIDNG